MHEKLKDLEKNMTNLRTEVENTASNYEKIRVTKEERLAHDLNQKVFVDRSQND